MKRLLIFAALLFVPPAHAEGTIEWVTVGDPGNAADDTGYGAVAYTYQISKYEITNFQYAAFLNAVAATDTYGLYRMDMSGIMRSGSPGSYVYYPLMVFKPVVWVSFYDALRFANWLHNGQPTGAQDSTTTEDGAYTMVSEGYPDGPFIARNVGATVFVPSEDEWYKAAYYDAESASYFNYPASSDTQTTCALPGATANTANCDLIVHDLTDVGSYTGSASPSGTFDQGGNVWEWNEAIYINTVFRSVDRGLRGGAFDDAAVYLGASSRNFFISAWEDEFIGFRVANRIPPVPSLSPMGVALTGGVVFGIGIVGLVIAARRRRN